MSAPSSSHPNQVSAWEVPRRPILADQPLGETGIGPTGPPPGPTGRRRRDRNWFWILFASGALSTVVIVLILRWRPPADAPTIALVGFTPLFAVPLAFGLLGAWLGRSSAVRVFAAMVTAAFVFTVSPVDAAIGCRAETASDALTIYTANVEAGSGRPADVAAAVVAADPDVVLLQEVKWQFLETISADPVLADYPYWSHTIDDGSRARPVVSKWPIVEVEVERFVASELVHATIDGPTGRFTVTNVHTLAPAVTANVATWHSQFDQLGRVSRSTPRIMAGDFNATDDHQPFRQLVDSGWTDAHHVKGCGFDATWPADGVGLPFAVYRLDHVLVTDHFEVLDLRLGDPAGSDHKPVITDIRLRTG